MTKIFERIKEKVDIIQICERYGLEVLHNNKAFCFANQEKTPSLTIYPKTQSFYCYSCGIGGDQIVLVRLFLGLNSNGEAAQRINEDFSLGLSEIRSVEFNKSESNKFYEDKSLVEWFDEIWLKKAKFDIAAVVKCLRLWEKSFPPDSEQYAVAEKYLSIIKNLRDTLIAGTFEEIYRDFEIINYYLYSKFHYFTGGNNGDNI